LLHLTTPFSGAAHDDVVILVGQASTTLTLPGRTGPPQP
jgi:hypothetical protein